MHYYPFNPSSYLLSTSHWGEDRSVVQCEAGLLRDLVYRRLLDLYYGEEEPIPSKTRLVSIRIRMLRHEDIVASVLREKFKLVDGFWRQNRADEEIHKYQKKAATARANGAKGGRPTKEKPSGFPSGSDPVATRTRTRTKKNTPLPPEGEVWWLEFWQAYPRKEGKPAALKAFAKALGTAPSFADIMDGLRRYIGCDQWTGDPTKIPHAATWLNREGWNDIPPKAGGMNGHNGHAASWWDSGKGILDKGIELGLSAPGSMEGPPFWEFTAHVWKRMGDGPWIDDKMQAYRFFVRMRDEGMGT